VFPPKVHLRRAIFRLDANPEVLKVARAGEVQLGRTALAFPWTPARSDRTEHRKAVSSRR